jgi:transketolase C-terminal domain/subunit
VNGGLGSAVAEAIAEGGVGATMKRVGLTWYGESGTTEELYDKVGFTGPKIAQAARALLG